MALPKTTGPDLGDLTPDRATSHARYIMAELPRTGGFFRRDGEWVHYSFDQWWGRNRAPSPTGKLFVWDDRSLDAYVIDPADLEGPEQLTLF